jgi:toxin ParE1/3/4
MKADLWTVVFSKAAEQDLDLIEAHLSAAYRSFGESPTEASTHAATRIEAILAAAERLATAPLRGQARDDLLPGLRQLSLDGAVYWFIVDEDVLQVRVLAMFFGGQDHQRHMLVRLLQKPAS